MLQPGQKLWTLGPSFLFSRKFFLSDFIVFLYQAHLNEVLRLISWSCDKAAKSFPSLTADQSLKFPKYCKFIFNAVHNQCKNTSCPLMVSCWGFSALICYSGVPLFRYFATSLNFILQSNFISGCVKLHTATWRLNASWTPLSWDFYMY